MDLEPDKLRARFHALTAQGAAIRAKAAPLRARYEALVNAHRAAERPVIAALKAAEAPLFDIDLERVVIVKALGGKTGPAPASAGESTRLRKKAAK